MRSKTDGIPEAPTEYPTIRVALRWQAVTVAWMIVEGLASLWAGITSGSFLLVAFGADSVIELISAAVLFHRLCQVDRAQPGATTSREARERKAAHIAGCLLYALSAYVVVQAVYGLVQRHEADTSLVGLTVAVAAAIGMPVLASIKLRIADRLGSRALRADAMESLTCGFLAWVLLAGLAANAILHWWWLDATASLAIVPLLLREARESTRGNCGCTQSVHR